MLFLLAGYFFSLLEIRINGLRKGKLLESQAGIGTLRTINWQERAAFLNDKKNITIFSNMGCFIWPAVCDTPGFAAEASASGMQQESKYGVSFALAVLPFVGGDSGPTTPISATHYKDTFNTGYGGRIEIFYDWTDEWRLYLGGIYNKWQGQFFHGGEFPNGARFDDFSMAGVYIGAKYRFNKGSRIRPYFLGNLGIVSMSSVEVTVNGNKIPYWDQTYRDYLDLGAGIEYGLTNKVALYLDVRLEAFGKPNSANFPIAEPTGGQSLPITFGIDCRF